MKFQSADIRTAAAKGLCKLLVNDRIESPNLVSHLLIMWYNPVTGIVVLFMFYFCTACIVQGHIQKFLDWSVMKYICTFLMVTVASFWVHTVGPAFLPLADAPLEMTYWSSAWGRCSWISGTSRKWLLSGCDFILRNKKKSQEAKLHTWG